MERQHKLSHLISSFLFSRANREFLIFLFFLALSGIFWLMTTLNETYEKEVRMLVRIVNVPKNVVLTSPETDTVRITLRDKGITLVPFVYGDALSSVNVDFRSYAHSGGVGSLPASELQKLVSRRLPASTKIVSVKPDKLELFYNYGEKKVVPIRWSGRVIPEQLYFISDVVYKPDSVTIYASRQKLDSINMVYTEPLNYADFRDTLTIDCHLRRITGVKMVPEQVTVSFLTDVLTEVSIDNIPVQGINMPAGKVLRTFPSKVSVSFVAGVSVFRTLSPNDFEVIADYNELQSTASPKCNIYLRTIPHGVSRAALKITEVDYLIEEQSE